MPPYARDGGLTQAKAERLAARIRLKVAGTAEVGPEGRYFVVTVATESGTYTRRDEVDWAWLQRSVHGRE